jgi:RND family efflux transporter MFP subunit
MLRIALLLLTVATLGACDHPVTTGELSPPAKRVVVAMVEEEALQSQYSLTATTRAVERAVVAPQVNGVVRERPADLGERVERGALLARLDNPELAPALEAAKARLAELRLQHQQAERDWQRVAELFEQGVVTRREQEEAQTRRNALQAAIASAEAQVVRARRMLAELELRAPISGEVDYIAVEPGEYVPAGKGVIGVAGESVEVPFGLPERLLPGLRLDQAVTLSLPLFDGRQVMGRIVELADTTAQASRLFPVVVALAAGEGIRPGLTATWSLQREGEPRLMVPLQALASPAGAAPRLFRLRGERVEAVAVMPGTIQGERVAVEGAIQAGDEVVVAGINGLVDGYPVEVIR